VDTNILVYAHDITAGQKHERAKALIAGLWENRMGCLSVQVLQEFYVTVTRKAARPLDSATAAQIIADLGTWRIHTPDVGDVLEAIQIQQRYGIAFWDAMVVQSAAQLGCSVLWSEDLNRGQEYAGVQVSNLFVSS
jgi:predicted nucleic acid-binding protein